MKVFTCDDHQGYWVGAASVVVAKDIDEAHGMMVNELKTLGLLTTDFTLKELDLSKPSVTVLQDGDY